MGRRKQIELVEGASAAEPVTATRPVKVHETTRREWVEDKPVEISPDDVEVIEDETEDEESEPDLFSTFDEMVELSETAQLRLWQLPNFERDGRASMHGTNRVYCGQIEYHAKDAGMLDKVAARVPDGGTVQVQLFVDGRVRRQGLVKLLKTPAAPPNPFIIQTTGNGAGVTPLEIAKQQMSFAKDLYAMAREMMPQQAAAQIAPAETAATSSEPTTGDRLIEAVLLRAIEGNVPDNRLERILNALTGRAEKPSGFADSLAPVIGDLVKHLGPAIGVMAHRWAIAQPGPPLPQAAPATPGAPPGAAPLTPAATPDAAWVKVVRRLVEDLADGCNPNASAEAIVDLLDRFPQFEPQIEGLLNSEPPAVINLCAMVMANPAESQFVSSLQTHPQAIAWVQALQNDVKTILQESAEDEGEEIPGEDSTPTPKEETTT